MCSDNQHVFIPFVFDTFGFIASEVVDLLHRVQRVMHNNAMSPRSMNVVFMRIDFAIQKCLTSQLVARLPPIHVPYQAFRRPDSDLKSRPMTGRRPDQALRKYGRPDLDLAKPNSA
ncbi:hypothetical protein MTR_7g100970 [Medicago truncatula]|uniref:Uncharacterized protein n=1 Tax=Medicago truncatula TaxID=3880 RepID=G7L1T1_MEDTR|nr:hypothetical protein MTR_7g100970 [Medicago truncatula]